MPAAQGIGVKEVAFVGYPVTDMARSRAFYGGVLGLAEGLVAEEDGDVHWVEYDVAGVPLALAKASEDWQPSPQGGGVSLEVADMEAALAHLEESGVDPTMPIGDFPTCRICVIPDPDGNGIALHQRKQHHPDFN